MVYAFVHPEMPCFSTFNHSCPRELQGNLETVKTELREQLAAKPTVVFVQYSLGHNEDEDLPRFRSAKGEQLRR